MMFLVHTLNLHDGALNDRKNTDSDVLSYCTVFKIFGIDRESVVVVEGFL